LLVCLYRQYVRKSIILEIGGVLTRVTRNIEEIEKVGLNNYSTYNDLLNKKLLALSEKEKDYWSFKGNSNREYGHGLFQYPAMMVPQITKIIIDKIIDVHPDIASINDPFVGSGDLGVALGCGADRHGSCADGHGIEKFASSHHISS
jgi:hypothetical protein